MQEEQQVDSNLDKTQARKNSSQKKLQVLDDGVISEAKNQQLPALVKESPEVLEYSLKKIEQHLNSIISRQQSGVSAEFNALMDGYVNKANESQEYKVKYEQLVSQYEDFKVEFRTIKETNKKNKEDLEALREALRASEADLQRCKKEIVTNKKLYEDQFADFTDERERLKTKLKQLSDHKEKTTAEYTQLKTEFMEMQYRVKQVEQEKEVESETAKRSVKEANKIVDELKDKLELRTREIEYKDALLNQLIKQISADDSLTEAMGKEMRELKREKAVNEGSSGKLFQGFNKDAHNGLKTKEPRSMSWGAFRN